MAESESKVVEVSPAADQSNRTQEAVAKLTKVETPVKPVTTPAEDVIAAQAKVMADYAKKEVNLCWNCANNGVESKLVKGVCDKCGFDKTPIYNIQLEPGRKV